MILSRDGSRRRGGGNDTPPPVELTLSSSQKVTVMRECGSHRCSHLSDLGSPDIRRGRRKWSQMIGGGTPNGSGVPFPSTEVNTKKGSFWATLVADGRQPFYSGLKTKRLTETWRTPKSFKPALKTVQSLLARERREILQWNPVKKIR